MTGDQFTFLLVDDQAFTEKMVRAVFAAVPGVDIEYCSDPRQAVAKTREVIPDLVFLDMSMPDVDGLTVLRFLQGHPETADIPVVVVSGSENPEEIDNAFAAGATDFMLKLPPHHEMIARSMAHAKRGRRWRDLQRRSAQLALDLGRDLKRAIEALEGSTNTPDRAQQALALLQRALAAAEAGSTTTPTPNRKGDQ